MKPPEEASRDPETCPVCGDEFSSFAPRFRLDCAHVFCEQCLCTHLIGRQLRTEQGQRVDTCPLCRSEVRNCYEMAGPSTSSSSSASLDGFSIQYGRQKYFLNALHTYTLDSLVARLSATFGLVSSSVVLVGKGGVRIKDQATFAQLSAAPNPQFNLHGLRSGAAAQIHAPMAQRVQESAERQAESLWSTINNLARTGPVALIGGLIKSFSPSYDPDKELPPPPKDQGR